VSRHLWCPASRKPSARFLLVECDPGVNDEAPEQTASTASSPSAEGLPSRLSADLEALRVESAGKPLTVEELQSALKGRGVAMLLLLLSLPFCFIPVPGLSTPFGVAVLLMGIRIALGQKPWLPRLVSQRSISPSRLVKVLTSGIRFARIMEKIVKPRMQFLHCWPGAMNLIGVGIASGGLLLLLPLPIPFSNMVPAWAVVLLSAGMMERDGVLVLVGHLLTFLSWGCIVLAWLFGAKGIQKVFNIFGA
jgi:hypothetical protein